MRPARYFSIIQLSNSRVHETIIIPESMSPGKEMLSGMVEEINHTQVDAEEVLSDQAYFYDRAHKRLSL